MTRKRKRRFIVRDECELWELRLRDESLWVHCWAIIGTLSKEYFDRKDAQRIVDHLEKKWPLPQRRPQ